METRSASGAHSSENTASVWIILAALLVVSTLVAMGALVLLSSNQQREVPTGSQTAPAR